MKRPSTQTLVMGHPVIAVPTMLLCGATLLAAFHEGNLLIALFAVLIWASALSANQQATKFRTWKRAWDAMDAGAVPVTRRAKANPMLKRMLGLALVCGLTWLALHEAGYAAGSSPVVWVIPTLLVLGFAVRRKRYHRQQAKPAASVQVIAKRLLSVPTVADAYRALPDYCHALLRGQA